MTHDHMKKITLDKIYNPTKTKGRVGGAEIGIGPGGRGDPNYATISGIQAHIIMTKTIIIKYLFIKLIYI